ncbi:large ribosomal subunit protein uL3m [Cylas formicarius]|uniref:large ribosomal subunit protein uL3m n=1 Tax=Cylas formicarius TaxID=197179 RepID=UPI002958DB17|nr:large ribosomal subunit protein uL3m [Cylas formicarius]
MALRILRIVKNSNRRLLIEENLNTVCLGVCYPVREKHRLNPKPRLRNPTWFVRKEINDKDELITAENKTFLKEIVEDKMIEATKNESPMISGIDWNPRFQRTGVLAKKIGIYPMWMKNGTKMLTTLLQILDNHVIKYYSPEEYDQPRKRPTKIYNKKGCLLLGAEATDPSMFTKEYCGLFKDSGVIPKRYLARFFISPDAALPLGTLITARHFQVGNYVDVRGKTIDRGFQGVMKRHGFKGMPASHGVTKTHRRGGNIGGGGEKGRVWPGTKMPGHMGNRYRITRGLKIWRINTKHNVLYVSGQAIPGETNSLVYIYDTKLPLRKPQNPVPFPTYLGESNEDDSDDVYDEAVHVFSSESTIFSQE